MGHVWTSPLPLHARRFSWAREGPLGQRFQFGVPARSYRVGFGTTRSKPLAEGGRVNRTLPVSPRARGAAAASKSGPGGGAPRRRISVSVFRQRRLELRGRLRRQLDRALADLSIALAILCAFPRARGEPPVITWRRGWEIDAGACYGEAADGQPDRANRGLPLWVCLLWNFGGYRSLVSANEISR